MIDYFIKKRTFLDIFLVEIRLSKREQLVSDTLIGEKPI